VLVVAFFDEMMPFAERWSCWGGGSVEMPVAVDVACVIWCFTVTMPL
jgi:hypothetical protein